MAGLKHRLRLDDRLDDRQWQQRLKHRLWIDDWQLFCKRQQRHRLFSLWLGF